VDTGANQVTHGGVPVASEHDRGLPKLGINLVPVRVDALAATARCAEGLGFESVWLGEHVVTLIEDVTADYPGRKSNFEPGSPLLDPLIALSHIAAATSTIRLGTAVLCLPLRDPLLTAREIATLDHLSSGRLEVGAALGWMRPEYQALGRDWRSRGTRLEEMLAILTGLFTGDAFEFHSAQFDIPPMVFGPRPLQSPRPPVHLGGQGPLALARSALLADGWIGGAKSVHDIGSIIETLRAHRQAADLSVDDFDVSIIMLHRPTTEQLYELRIAGVRRVIVTPWTLGDGDPPMPGQTEDIAALRSFAADVGLHRSR
jgi:probable F420-dependent oxidoreductase